MGSFNIRYAPVSQWQEQPPTAHGSERPWTERRTLLADQILYELPAVIGLQEVLDHQLQDLAALLGGRYDYVGVGRDDGQRAGEAVPIFYRRDLFERVGEPSVEHFWLSETPDVPGSISWDASQTRMATLVHLAPLGSPREHVHAINTHFDDRGVVSREKASGVILERLAPLMAKGELILLTGDLNSEDSEGGYRVLTD